MSELYMITNVDIRKSLVVIEEPVFEKSVTLHVSEEEVAMWQSLLIHAIEAERSLFVKYDSESGVIIHDL